jgi:hypothetical protein
MTTGGSSLPRMKSHSPTETSKLYETRMAVLSSAGERWAERNRDRKAAIEAAILQQRQIRWFRPTDPVSRGPGSPGLIIK